MKHNDNTAQYLQITEMARDHGCIGKAERVFSGKYSDEWMNEGDHLVRLEPTAGQKSFVLKPCCFSDGQLHICFHPDKIVQLGLGGRSPVVVSTDQICFYRRLGVVRRLDHS